MTDNRNRIRHSDINSCRAAVERSGKCTWPGCTTPRAGLRDRNYGDAPVCTAHFYEIWAAARDLAHRNARREWYDDCPEVRDYIAKMIARYSPGQHEKPGAYFRPEAPTPTGQPMRMRRRSRPQGWRVA